MKTQAAQLEQQTLEKTESLKRTIQGLEDYVYSLR